ncbi:MAG: DUF2779 domain-containing protein [Bacteroidia bacterium]
MSKPILSKSTYIRSLQCLKSLYLYKNYYTQRDKISVEQQARFSRGHSVGALAHQLFPGGVDASKGVKQRSKDALIKTLDLIQKGEKIIYEASFQYDDVWVIADILVNDETGWKVYEVKSSMDISDTFMNDAALQYYVISNALPQIVNAQLADFSLVYVNKNYVLQGALDVRRFFLFREMKTFCEEQTDFVKSRLIKAKLTLDNGKIPAIETGEHCFNPYPCDYQGTCFKNVSKISTLHLNETEINSVLQNHQEKIYVLEFLKSRPAVPMFDGTQPYQNLLFQFSIVDVAVIDNKITQFISEDNKNPNSVFIEQLIKQTIEPGIILVNDYESKCFALQDVADHYPEYAASLIIIKQRLKSIADFFIKDDNSSPTLNEINAYLKLNPFMQKGFVKNKTEATAAFEEMQMANDLFKNMELSEALTQFSKDCLNDMIEMINQLRRFISKPVNESNF